MEKYYSAISDLGLDTTNLWDRSLDDIKGPIVNAIIELMDTSRTFISSRGGCVPCSKELLGALLAKFQDIEQVPFAGRPHTFLYQGRSRLIIDSTYLQFFDVGQSETVPHTEAFKDPAQVIEARTKQISESIGAVLVATPPEVKRLFVKNRNIIAINGVVRDWQRTEESASFLAHYQYQVPAGC